jgi:gamma-butyrobetaine dioxygenase
MNTLQFHLLNYYYSLNWLKKAYTSGLTPKDSSLKLWSAKDLRKESLLARVEYQDYMQKDEGLLRALGNLDTIGLVMLKNVPVDNEEQVRKVVERIGPIRNSFYGETWNVKSVSGAKNIAYTALPLGLHMDLMSVTTL